MEQNQTALKLSPPPWMMGVASVVALFLIAYLAALTRNAWRQYTFIGRSAEAPHTITIAGEGKVTAIPDVAVVMLGMHTERKNVAEAQRENTRVINSLIDRVKQLGVAKEDVVTSQYTVYPQYDYDDGRQRLRGYSVDQQLTVKVRDFEDISPLISTVGELGLNQVGGVQFTIDDPESFRQQARVKALAQAKAKAQALAGAAGVRLGRIIEFSEGSSSFPPPMPYLERAVGLGGDAAAAPVIEPGSQEVLVSVTVRYELE